MASSIKPSNTLAAAYTFEICLLSPYIHDAIRALLGEGHSDNGPLLDLITLLILELKKQFKKCQENMYDAAKSVSMYGVLFSIRHLMQKSDIS